MEGSISLYKLITKYNFTIIHIMLNSVSKKRNGIKKVRPTTERTNILKKSRLTRF